LALVITKQVFIILVRSFSNWYFCSTGDLSYEASRGQRMVQPHEVPGLRGPRNGPSGARVSSESSRNLGQNAGQVVVGPAAGTRRRRRAAAVSAVAVPLINRGQNGLVRIGYHY